MAAAVAAAAHSPLSQVAPAAPVHYPLTGFVRIEDDTEHRKRASSSSLSSSLSLSSKNKAKGKVCSRWLFAVLLPGKLQLYARRQDYKRQTPPSDEINMQVRARSANESVFGFDHECVYIRSSDTGHVITVRIHQKKDIVRWVTALYYQSFSSKSPSAAAARSAAGKHDSAQQPEPTTAADAASSQTVGVSSRAKRKSVSFQEEPEVLVLPRQSYDPADLFYSEREYEQFQQMGDKADDDATAAAGTAAQPPKKNLSRLMKSIYAKTAAKLKVSPKTTMSLEQLR